MTVLPYPAILALFVTWALTAFVVGQGVDRVERTIFREGADAEMGWVFWCITTAGGAAAGGFVALAAAVHALATTGDPSIGWVAHGLIVAGGVFVTSATAVSRWVLVQ